MSGTKNNIEVAIIPLYFFIVKGRNSTNEPENDARTHMTKIVTLIVPTKKEKYSKSSFSYLQVENRL